MNLLIFSYALAAFLFLFSFYLDSSSEKGQNLFTNVAMASSFTALFAGISVHLFFYGNPSLALLLFRTCLLCLSFVVVSLFRFSISIPYNTDNAFIKVINWLSLLFCGYLVFVGITSFGQDPTGAFIIGSAMVFGVIDGLVLYALIFVFAFPALTIISLLMRVVGMKSRIYRQRLLFVTVSIIVGFSISILLYKLSFQYPLAFPLIPFGLAVMLVLIYQAISVTTLFDRTLALATFLNFTVLNFIFSVATAAMVLALINHVSSIVLLGILLIIVVVLMLFIREWVSQRMRKYIRVGVEYEAEIEAGFETIDYTSGGAVVIQRTVELLDQYVDCSSVDILVSDEKGKLLTVHSTSNSKNELVISDNNAIDFLLSYNESVVLKTQAITTHLYADIKPNLLSIFDLCRADAMILIREGHRIVGIILLGPKKRGGDYTEYDYSVLTNLYSSFFLIMYYLKNIANESVVLTVDREIEFSGQKIGRASCRERV